MAAISSPKLVDRQDDLRRLDDAWAAVAAGHPALVVLGGEAGIGKSRLVRELAGLISAAGGRALVGACLRLGETPIPLLAIGEIVRRLATGPDAGGRAAVEALEGELAPLAPRPAGRDGAAPREAAVRPDLGEASARARLFEGVLALVQRLAADRPTLLAVEDVHWSDPATRDLLTFLVRNVADERLLLVLSLRTDGLAPSDPVVGWLAELLRAPASDRVDLDRLPPADVVRQVEAITGQAPTTEALDVIFGRSEGNPFFVEELVAAGAARAAPDDPAPGATLPRTLAEIMLSRIAVLSPAARRVVRAVALAGTPVEESLVARALGVPAEELREALREAIDAGLLRADDDGRVRPRHAVLGEVVEAALLAGERRELHAALAAGFDDARDATGRDAASVAAARARHWLAAERPFEAYHAALDAAGAASAVYAHAEAARHLRLALQLGAGLPDPPPPHERLALLLRAADTLDLAGDAPAAIGLVLEALRLVDERSDPATAGGIHSRLGYLRWVVGQGDESLEEHRRAVALVPPDPPTSARAQVLGALGGALMGAGRYAESRAVCEDAVRVAVAAGAATQESRARNMLGSDLVALGEVDAGLAELRRARAIAEQGAPLDMLVVAHHNLALNLLLADRRDEAVTEALAGRDVARRLGLERRYGVHLAGVAADALFRSGRWDEAARLAGETLGAVPGSRSALHLVAVRARLEAARGDGANGIEPLEAAARLAGEDADPDLRAYVALARAEAALATGRPGDAVAAAREGIAALAGSDDAVSELPLLAVACAALAELAEDARATHDSDAAAASASEAAALAARAASLGSAARTPSATAWAARATAESRRAAGDTGADPWSAAVAAADAARLAFAAAEARYRLAEARLRSRTERGPAEAALREALDAAEAVRAQPLATACRALARRARVDLLPAPSSAAGGEPHVPPHDRSATGPRAALLSERELEVLRLVAQGRSNGEIAQALFITRKTASAHVTHILDKLGVSNRLEAAMTAVRAGLIPPPDAP